MSFDLKANRHAKTWSKRLFIAERYLLSFSMGIFALLPVYLLSIGRDEVFFGSISACGVIAAIVIIIFSPSLVRQLGIRRLAPVGGLLYATGCATMVLNELSAARLPIVYFAGYAIQSAGWALHFTVGSICISALSGDSDRSLNFMIYAALSTLGLTCGPLLCSVLSTLAGTPVEEMFALATVTALVGSSLSTIASSLSAGVSDADIPKNVPIIRELPKLITGKALLFFVLVFLSASIYTTLINFQATFAGVSGLSYEVFFACWAMGVVGSRFSVGSQVARSAGERALPLLLGGMVLSLLTFLLAPGNAIIYGMASLAIGVTYGLSYPVIQAEAIRVAPTHARTVVQIIFSLSYFAGLYFFPLVAGLVSVHLGYDALIWLVASLALLQTVLAVLGYRLIRARPFLDNERGIVKERTDV
jgi:MFS family permease